MSNFDQYSDVIDSRDVLERLGELADAWVAWKNDWPGSEPQSDEDKAEILELESLVSQLREVGGDDPEDGQTLVRDSYFMNYAQELAEECGYEISDEWPYRCIDWALAARELQMDYTPVEFYGVTYWVR